PWRGEGRTALPLADGRHHVFAKQFDGAHGRLVGHARFLAVEYQVAQVQLVFEKAEFFQDRIWGSCDNVVVRLQFLGAFLAQRLAFTGSAARRYLTGDTTPVPG